MKEIKDERYVYDIRTLGKSPYNVVDLEKGEELRKAKKALLKADMLRIAFEIAQQ